MLALLAKIRGTTNTTRPSSPKRSPMSSGEVVAAVVGKDVKIKESLLQLSTEVDRQLTKLMSLMNGTTVPTTEDYSVVTKVLAEYNQELSSIESSLLAIQKSHEKSLIETENLLTRLDRLISIEYAAPQSTTSPNESISASSSTPSTSHVKGPPSRFTPPLPQKNFQTTPKSNRIDFDAFPQTPTLEQLGLSRATLDAVGERLKVGKRSNTFRKIDDEERKDRNSSGMETEPSLRHSLDSASLATPRMTNLRSSSSLGSNPNLATRLTDLSADLKPQKPPTFRPEEIYSTPTVVHGGANDTSPFGGGGGPSSTVFGGRPSDAFSVTYDNEF